MFKLIGRSRFVLYFMILLLAVTVTTGPMLLPYPGVSTSLANPTPPSGSKPSVDELRERKEKEALAAQQRLEKILDNHAANRKNVELKAPYWHEGDGFNSTVVMNNSFIRSINVTPVIFTSTGKGIEAATVTLLSHESRNFTIRDLFGDLQGYGQMLLRYEGEMAEINAQMVIEDASNSLVFDHAFESASDYSTTTFEGIFYIPSANSNADIALSNSGGTTISVDLKFMEEGAKGKNGNSSRERVAIAPHQTELINARPYFNRDHLPKAVRVTISSTGLPGDLIPQGMVSDSNGFSANIRFLESAMLQGGKLFSPILPISSPLNPTVLLSNPGTQDISVELEAYYSVNGEVEDKTLYNATLATGTSLHVDLGQTIRTLVPNDATNVGLAISYGPKGSSLLADVLLIDASGSGVYQVSPKGYNSVHYHFDHSFPFRIGGTQDTIITIANPSETESVTYSLNLTYSGKTYAYSGTLLRPGEVRYIDIKQLRDLKVRGNRNATIPVEVTSGVATLHFNKPKNTGNSSANHADHTGDVGSLNIPFASATLFDEASKTSFSTCNYCSPPEFLNMVLWDEAGDSGGYDWLQMENFEAGGEGRSMHITIYDTHGEYALDSSYVSWQDITGISGWGSGSSLYVGKLEPGYQEIGATVDLYSIYCPCGDSWGWAFAGIIVGVTAQDLPKIFFNSVNITGSTTEVIVGQPIALSFTTNGTATNPSWSVPGYTVGGYDPSTVPALPPSSVNFSQASPTFYWVDGGANRTVTLTVTVAGMTQSSSTTFNVVAPSGTMSATAGSAAVIANINPSTVGYGNANTTVGVSFTNNFNIPAGWYGSFQWLQFINDTASVVHNAPANTNFTNAPCSGRDTNYPYTAATPTSTNDSPSQGMMVTGASSWTRTDSFTMTLTFSPANTNAIWIPISKVTWGWSYTATSSNGGNTWSITSRTPAGTLAPIATTDFPVWSGVVSNTLCPFHMM